MAWQRTVYEVMFHFGEFEVRESTVSVAQTVEQKFDVVIQDYAGWRVLTEQVDKIESYKKDMVLRSINAKQEKIRQLDKEVRRLLELAHVMERNGIK